MEKCIEEYSTKELHDELIKQGERKGEGMKRSWFALVLSLISLFYSIYAYLTLSAK